MSFNLFFSDFSTLSLNRLFTDPWKHCKDAQGRQGHVEVQLFSENHRKSSAALYGMKYSRSSTDQLCQCWLVVPPAEMKPFPTIPECLHPTAHRDAWSQTCFNRDPCRVESFLIVFLHVCSNCWMTSRSASSWAQTMSAPSRCRPSVCPCGARPSCSWAKTPWCARPSVATWRTTRLWRGACQSGHKDDPR